MSLKLYGYWRSSATYRVRIALNLKQLNYEYIPVHLVNDGGEQNSEVYQQLNPSKLVPTLVDENMDVTLHQSLAIIEYLDDKFPSDVMLLPAHPQDKARVRMLAYDIAADLQPITNLRVLNKLRGDYKASDEQINHWVRHWIDGSFNALTTKIQSRAGKFAYGYQVTMADLCIVPQVYNALRFGVKMSDYPVINKIYHNCNELDAFERAAPENQVDAS